MATPIITVDPLAAEKAVELLASRGKPSAGIRVGVRSRGCSGMSYTLEFADEAQAYDEIVDAGNFKIFVDSKAVMFLLGTRMEYQEDKFKSGFEFVNPNEKGRCGCGESFTV